MSHLEVKPIDIETISMMKPNKPAQVTPERSLIELDTVGTKVEDSKS